MCSNCFYTHVCIIVLRAWAASVNSLFGSRWLCLVYQHQQHIERQSVGNQKKIVYNQIEKEWIVEVWRERERANKTCASLRINYQALSTIHVHTAVLSTIHRTTIEFSRYLNNYARIRFTLIQQFSHFFPSSFVLSRAGPFQFYHQSIICIAFFLFAWFVRFYSHTDTCVYL